MNDYAKYILTTTVEASSERASRVREWCAAHRNKSIDFNTADKFLSYLGSYDIARALRSLMSCMEPADWWRLFGQNWTGADDAFMARPFFRAQLRAASRRRLALAMDELELAVLDGLSNSITVYRGCGPGNENGLSWSLSRDVAVAFPTQYWRYKVKEPLLLTGTAPRNKVVLKLDRQEQEVLTAHVKIVNRQALEVQA